jgi:hypothetical protein
LRGTRAKKLRRRSEEIIVEWLRTLVPEGEEQERINTTNYQDFLPEELYYRANGTTRLQAMTPKYVQKALKKNLNVTYKDLISA